MKREKEPSDPTRDGEQARGLDLRTVSRRPWIPAWLQVRSSGSRCVASNRCFQRSLSVLALLLSGAQGRRMVSNQHKNVLLKETAKSENDRHVIGKVVSENCYEFQCRQSLKSEDCMGIGRVL